MAQPYIGEIRMFAGNYEPVGWSFCQGQLVPISENETLFNLIGTTYGGDGQSTFALPDLRGRVPFHFGTIVGTSYQLGQNGGAETVTLSSSQLPVHTHPFLATGNAGNQSSPVNFVPASSNAVSIYKVPPGALTAMAPQAMGSVGGSQPHSNFQPYLCVNFIISLAGIYPSQ